MRNLRAAIVNQPASRINHETTVSRSIRFLSVRPEPAASPNHSPEVRFTEDRVRAQPSEYRSCLFRMLRVSLKEAEDVR